MKTKTLKKLIKDYAKICETLGFTINPNFKKEFLHIKRMKTNSTKISFIKKDKIEGLEKNVKGFILKPNCKEQRDKYFTAVKPSKFLSSMILADNNKEDLFARISEQFNKDFINNLKSKLVLFSDSDISRIYNSASVVGCMSRANESWIKVYNKTQNLQLATLSDEADTILIRALLWYDKESNNYWLDNTYEQSALNGDNEIRKEYQRKLLCLVIENLISKDLPLNSGDIGTEQSAEKEKNKDVLSFGFGCNFAGCLDSSVVEEIEQEYKIKIFRNVKRRIKVETINTGKEDENGKTIYTEAETQESKDSILLKPFIVDYEEENFTNFPYSDTFRSIGRTSGKWFLGCNQGDDEYICCQSQNGEDENDTGTNCECCNERVTNEDYIHYSEIEEEYLYDECCCYIEERDESCRMDNAIYNNYSGNYHYRYDIE